MSKMLVSSWCLGAALLLSGLGPNGGMPSRAVSAGGSAGAGPQSCQAGTTRLQHEEGRFVLFRVLGKEAKPSFQLLTSYHLAARSREGRCWAVAVSGMDPPSRRWPYFHAAFPGV